MNISDWCLVNYENFPDEMLEITFSDVKVSVMIKSGS